MEKKTNLEELIRKIQKDEILLPDFQRGFVWTDEMMQRKLIASVLTKMPLGSILLLDAQPKEYGYKMIGRKTKKNADDIDSKEIQVLLDGQQRMTVLTNIFSSIIYKDLGSIKNLISNSLKRRFFITIPSYPNINVDEDLWGLKSLQFPLADPINQHPNFLTGDILEFIEIESFKQDDKTPYNPSEEVSPNLDKFCIGAEKYRIPLYLLIEDDSNQLTSKNEIRLNKILSGIVDDAVEHILIGLDRVGEQERKHYVDEFVVSDYGDKVDKLENYKDLREKFGRALKDQGRDMWQDRMKNYLKSCIQNMDLHQIIVKQSDRERAIDIYENLNLGGVTLSTFDLILAKAARRQEDYEINLYDKICKSIEAGKTYNKEVLPEEIEPHFVKFQNDNQNYSASNRMKCYNRKKNELNKKYIDAFLNILSLKSNVQDYDSNKIDIELIKRKKILQLSSEEINDNCKSVCVGLDRACFFLQTRCGLRDINELNYNLMLVLIGYIFSDDSFYNNKDVHKKLEAWYWITIFSGYYTKDQNTHIIYNLKCILTDINKPQENAYAWLDTIRKEFFNMANFSDEDAMLLNDGRETKEVVKKTICQYYLARSYKDMIGDQTIHIFMDDVESLEEHHIIPLGSKEDIFGSSLRKDKDCILNSPLNFAYITTASNKKISSNTIESYFKKCEESSMFDLELDSTSTAETEDDVRELLRKRRNKVKNHIEKRVNMLLGRS